MRIYLALGRKCVKIHQSGGGAGGPTLQSTKYMQTNSLQQQPPTPPPQQSRIQIVVSALFGKYLLFTNTLSAGFLMVAGDGISQHIEFKKKTKTAPQQSSSSTIDTNRLGN